jgi:hypothetical protein
MERGGERERERERDGERERWRWREQERERERERERATRTDHPHAGLARGRERVQQPPNVALLNARHCVACKQCQHGTTRKELHGSLGCAACGTHPTKFGGSGAGGCVEAAPGASCGCECCSQADERQLEDVLALARKDLRGFLQRCVSPPPATPWVRIGNLGLPGPSPEERGALEAGGIR